MVNFINMKLLLILFVGLFATPPIPYRQLTWSDYKGTPPAGVEHDAVTCTNIVIGPDTAYAIFLPERSWATTTDSTLLRHEQLHFAITRNYANKLQWYLKARCPCTIEIGEVINEWRQEQAKYDLETNHGQDTTAQRRWEEKIKL